MKPRLFVTVLTGAIIVISNVQAQTSTPPADTAADSRSQIGTGGARALDLFTAVFQSDVDSVKRLLDQIPSAERTLPGVEPILVLAARAASNDVVRVLLAAAENPNAKGSGGWTPLLAAIAADRLDAVKLLLDAGADADLKSDDGATAQELADAIGNPGVVMLIAKARRSDPLAMQTRRDLLLRAAAAGDGETVAAILNDTDSPDVADQRGWTALLYATAGGHVPIVKQLLEKGASVNHVAGNGITALMVATTTGNAELADLLLQTGADRALRNTLGQTAGAIAVAAGDPALAKLLGAVPDAASGHRRVAAAAARKDRDEVRKLLDSGAPAARPSDKAGTPAIVAAACAGDAGTIKLLLERGAKTEETDTAGATPLIASALCNQPDAARALIEARASTLAKTKEGIDALTAALARNSHEVAAVIAPAAEPSIDSAVQALQRKDLKTLALLVKANPRLGSELDSQGRVLVRHAILLGDTAILEAVIAMIGFNPNSWWGVEGSALAYAVEHNRPQAVRTLVKLGAKPTYLFASKPPSMALNVAVKRGAAEALQIMSQAARKEILEIQSVLFTFGFLKAAPDGAWGNASQSAWEEAGKFFGATRADYGEGWLGNVPPVYLRVCNQSGAKLFLAIYAKRGSSAGSIDAWYDIEHGRCTWLAKATSGAQYYIGASRTLPGAQTVMCTKNDRMDNERSQSIERPCKAPYNETTFVQVTDFSKPHTLR